MNENTRNAFASYGLEILKRSVLLVLYEGTDVYPLQGRVLKPSEISKELDIPSVQNPATRQHHLVCGILDQLANEEHAYRYIHEGWCITEKGVSLIEDGV